jgi:hypothetical protein
MMPCRRRQRRIISENRETKFQAPISPAQAHLKIPRPEIRIMAGERIFDARAIHIAVCGYGHLEYTGSPHAIEHAGRLI